MTSFSSLPCATKLQVFIPMSEHFSSFAMSGLLRSDVLRLRASSRVGSTESKFHEHERRRFYPSMAEITEAFKWLADRGFGQAPKTVQIEGSVTTGFKMVFRRWAPGCDPASLPLVEMPKQIVASARMLEAPKNGKPGANGSNGHTNGSNGTR